MVLLLSADFSSLFSLFILVAVVCVAQSTGRRETLNNISDDDVERNIIRLCNTHTHARSAMGK